MAFSGCLNDDTFGPAIHGCRDNFDFTIKFERMFLTLIPESIFMAIALIRIAYLGQRPRIVKGSWIWALKLVRHLLRLLIFS
jgi:ATP-binding cassette, subfamily C (CFTR/MRP), member 1